MSNELHALKNRIIKNIERVETNLNDLRKQLAGVEQLERAQADAQPQLPLDPTAKPKR